ncbi:sodium:proton antiporter [Conexibacter stalactiti]|uniref:Sodium:proton antiporter n=1 Tax=Conexibacter stalactiti TaxID=1940611 RepID=A0ABU4HR41_9ACTN|nr:sodium:proton antiporter [Conexibacter stalactiti]MDW5595710.1 sodium:proton antiporter [Conexibacter stalactiti]MEC5036352.1 sodium:proton antiporter [Conexibacter stalactiti]
MTLIFALAAAIVFGAGAFLVLTNDLVRVVAGMVLISQSAVLVVIASGLTRGDAPILPTGDKQPSDPLVQAMALTAIVIGLAVTALLLAIVARVRATLRSLEVRELARDEAEHTADLEQSLEEMYERLESPEEREEQ